MTHVSINLADLLMVLGTVDPSTLTPAQAGASVRLQAAAGIAGASGIVLTGYPDGQKVPIILALRRCAYIDLKTAKQISESMPCSLSHLPFRPGVTLGLLVESLQGVGADVTVIQGDEETP